MLNDYHHIPYCIRCSQGQRVLLQKRVNDAHWVCPNLDCDFALDEDMVVVIK